MLSSWGLGESQINHRRLTENRRLMLPTVMAQNIGVMRMQTKTITIASCSGDLQLICEYNSYRDFYHVWHNDISNRLHPSLSETNLMTKLDNTCALHHAASSFPQEAVPFLTLLHKEWGRASLSVYFFLFFQNPVVKNDCSTIEPL